MRRLHREVAKTVIFVTHDIDEAITMGDRIAILREGGVLAQYDTPDRLLAQPADSFVAEFIGDDRALRRLALHRLDEIDLDPVGGLPDAMVQAPARPPCAMPSRSCSRHDAERLLVVDDGGSPLGVLPLGRAAELLQR